MKVKKAFGMLILAMAVLALAGAAQTSAETAAPAPPAPAVAAPAQPGCGTGLELNLAAPNQGETCPVAQPASAAPDFLAPARFARRTCVCSCGYPCTTDADCGAGGRCGNGITCC
jgi:hypothetical protein